MTWDGTRWVEPPRRSSPAPGTSKVRDWFATGIMVAASLAIVLPLVMVEATSARVALSPSSGASGDLIAVNVAGMEPHTRIELRWDGEAAGMPAATTSRVGTLTLNFVVPTGAIGRHAVTVVRSGSANPRARAGTRGPARTASLASSPFDVTAEASSATAHTPGSAPPAGIGETSPPAPATASATPSSVPSPVSTAPPTPLLATPPPVAATPLPPTPAPTPIATPTPSPTPVQFTGVRPGMPGGALWADGFDGATLNPAHWGWDMAMVGTNDNMNRYAMFATDPRLVQVSNGTLKLKALQEADGSWIQSYISTRGKYAQQYGIFRASMRLPAGHALWPAFWMLDPTRYDEMDVIEAYPEAGNARYTFCTINTAGRPCSGMALPADFSTSFHVYEMEWRPGLAIARLDGVEVARQAIPEMRPQFMLLQMAVGVWFKNFAPDGSTPTNPTLEVDWVGTWP